MTTSTRLAVIGGGRMGEAIVGGLVSAKALPADAIVVVEPDGGRREVLQAAYGVRVSASGREAAAGAPTVLLAVKPQIIDAVVSDLAPALVPGALVVSIAAGVSCSRLESELPAGTAVVRVMPNTPALVGEAMSIVSGGMDASAEQVAFARSLFDAIGRTVVVDERYQDAGMAISGCGPAYVAIFVDALARAGVRQGLSRDVAQALAVQTLRGTADLLESTGQHPEQLVDAVSSPGGTTIAAVEALEDGAFRAVIASAVDAAVRRAKELG